MKKMDLMFVEDLALMENTGDVKIILAIELALDIGLKALTYCFLSALNLVTQDFHIIQQIRNVLKSVLPHLFQLKKMESIFARNLVLEMITGSMNKRNV